MAERTRVREAVAVAEEAVAAFRRVTRTNDYTGHGLKRDFWARWPFHAKDPREHLRFYLRRKVYAYTLAPLRAFRDPADNARQHRLYGITDDEIRAAADRVLTAVALEDA